MQDQSSYDFEYELMYMGMDKHNIPQYPRYMYKDGADPLLVKNSSEQEEAKARGFDSITAAAMSNRHLINWAWDLEDMSARQLVVFAMDEYDVELPAEAGQARLFKAVTELARLAPQNRNRLVLMAHTIQMNYEATLEEIRRMANGRGQGLESQTFTQEFWA